MLRASFVTSRSRLQVSSVPTSPANRAATCNSQVPVIEASASAASPGVFVAKADVLKWPVIGRLAAMSGTRFIERKTLSGLSEMVEDITRLLEQCARVVVFPEGTSTVGREVMPFSPALFQASIAAGATVQAVTLQYRHAAGHNRMAAFVGDDTFLSHLLRLLRVKRTCVCVSFESPLPAVGQKRLLLAKHTREQVSKRLQPGDDTCSIRNDEPADHAA